MQDKPEQINSENIGVVFLLAETHADALYEALSRDVREVGVVTALRKRPDFEVYNAVEWAVAGAITIYFLKPLYEGAMKEAGKDGWNALLAWFKKTALDARLIKVKLISAEQSPAKLNPTYSQSLSITPHIQLKGGRSIKLLFDERLSDEEWESAIERIFDAYADHFENYPNDLLTLVTDELADTPWQRIYGLIDMETKEWVFYNAQMLMEIERDRKGL